MKGVSEALSFDGDAFFKRSAADLSPAQRIKTVQLLASAAQTRLSDGARKAVAAMHESLIADES